MSDHTTKVYHIRLTKSNAKSIEQYKKRAKIFNDALAINHRLRMADVLEQFIKSDNRDDVTTWYTPPTRAQDMIAGIDDIQLSKLAEILTEFVEEKKLNEDRRRKKDDSKILTDLSQLFDEGRDGKQ